MDPQITKENFDEARYQLLLETAARVKVIQEVLVTMLAKISGEDAKALSAEMEKRVDRFMEKGNDAVYAEFGSINPFE